MPFTVESKHIQMLIVLGFVILLFAALVIDGEFGERCFGTLMAGFGLILGYFFRKSSDPK